MVALNLRFEDKDKMILLGGILHTIAFLKRKSGESARTGIGTTSKGTETDAKGTGWRTKRSWK